jgi:MFS family permease
MTVRTWRWNATFDALRQRDFRWLWLSNLANSATFQMGTVAQGWLVYELTGSALALGWVSSGWSISTLFLSLYGGVIADRMEKRRLILIMRMAMVLNMSWLAVVINLGVVRLWHLMASSLLSGVLMSFMMPAQITLVSDLVDRDTLLNAMSLSAIAMGLMGIVAASVAGVLIQNIGISGVYWGIVALHLLSFGAISQLPRRTAVNAVHGSIRRELRQGIGYLRTQPVLIALLGLGVSRIVLGLPYTTFMPKYASEVLHMDASGLGILTGTPGIGGMISALVLASLGNLRGKGKLMLGAGMILGVTLCLFAQVRWLPAVLVSLALAGAMGNLCMVAIETLFQSVPADEYRARMMSIYMMCWGLGPVGTIPSGALADHIGVPAVVTMQGALLTLIYLVFALRRTGVRALE